MIVTTVSSPLYPPSAADLGSAFRIWLAMAKLRPKPAEPFGARLRRLRAAKGLTQEELGAPIGLSKRMVAYYEIQGGTPSPDLLAGFARVLGASADDLVGAGRRSRSPAEGPRTALELRLWRKLRQLQKLPERERRAVFLMIDNALVRHGVGDDKAA